MNCARWLAAFWLLAAGLSAPAQPKRIYLANDDHTDYLWSADEATYQAAFLQMLDYYLDLADATATNPPELQSRWNCDGHFWVWTYEKHRSPARFNRLIERMRSGHISAPLNPLVIVFGGTPAEAVIRSAYYPGHLERRFGLRFPLAYEIEDQTLPYGLGALWAGCGAKYSWKGICNCATRVPGIGSRRPYEIYYWTGPDGSRLLMKWNSLAKNDAMGGYAEARSPAAVVDYVDGNSTFTSRYPYQVIGAFGKGWDDLKTLTGEFITVASNKTTAARKVIVSNETDFFEDFAATYTNLPNFNASFGNEWELLVASLAEVSARVKRSVEKLRAAEALAALVSLQEPGFLANRAPDRDLAFMDLGMYFEHDWTADGAISRPARAAWQKRLAGEIESYVETLHRDAARALGGMIRRHGTGTNLQFFAFNSLGWTRTDAADIPFSETNAVHVIDLASAQKAPSQVVLLEGRRFLRVLAKDVPPVGYKVFEVRSGEGTRFSPAATLSGTNILENQLYRITLSGGGAITSLVDQGRGHREFVRVIGGRAMNDLGTGSGTIALENAGPVSVTLLATASTPLAHRTRLTLLRDSPRVELRSEITQNFSAVQTWAFGFNLDSPQVRHEEVGAVLRARLLTDGGHYAPTHARYDWLTLNHFADISGGGRGVTLANADCYYFRLGNSSTSRLDTNTPQLTVLAGGQVDGPKLGIENQDGDGYFLQRFALRTHGEFDAPEAMRFAVEFQNPLVTGVLSTGTAYPAASFSLLSISNPGVLLWALKPAEEGITNGLIARMWNLSTNATRLSLRLSSPLVRAHRTTHIETDLESVPLNNGVLSVAIKGQQFQTYRLIPSMNPVAADVSPRLLPEGKVSAD
jgi:alpha-mannosidase